MIGLAEFQISTLLSATSARQGLSNRFQNSRSNDRTPLNPSVEDLVRELPCLARIGDGDGIVTCLISDSRRVVPGAFMMVISGGHDTMLQNAKKAMKGSLIGFALITGSYGIYRTVVWWFYP